MKTEDCINCRPVLMYKDDEGGVHDTEKKCEEAQVRIMHRRKAAGIIIMLLDHHKKHTPFGPYLDMNDPHYRGLRTRGVNPYHGIEAFIEQLVHSGYSIIKEEDSS